MREDDRQIGKVDRDVVDQHRRAVLEAHAPAATGAGSDPAVTGVKDHRHARRLEHFVERIDAAIVRHELLQRRVQFETAHTAGRNQPARFFHRLAPARRIDAHEGHENVGMRRGRRENVRVRNDAAAREALVDRKDDARHLARAIVRRELVERGRHRAPSEIPARRRADLTLRRIRRLGVNVHVDRDEARNVEHPHALRTESFLFPWTSERKQFPRSR
jgi:hypothetical protein